MKKFIAKITLAAMAVSMYAAMAATPASAAVYDNNGNAHNYVAMASTSVAKPDSFFPSGYSVVSGTKKAIKVQGGTIAYMVPQYDRNALSVDNTREATTAAAAGFYFDGFVSCNDRVKYSSTKRSLSSYTGWVWCNNKYTTYCGWAYWN